MTGPKSTFDIERYRRLHEDRDLAIGEPIVTLGCTGSTNDDAWAYAREGGSHGAVFVADEQTRGRGRRGHVWTSPPGENLLCSVVLRPTFAAERATAVTLAVGLAVRDAVAELVESPSLKWPNDVLANGKKLAGVLVESVLAADRLSAVVVGIGLNVSMRELPPDIRTTATSLALLGDETDRETALVLVLDHLERRFDEFSLTGVSQMLTALNAHDALRGRPIDADGTRGVGAGIDSTGALLVDVGERLPRRVLAGEVILATR